MKRGAVLLPLALAACMASPIPLPTVAPTAATGRFDSQPRDAIAPVPDDWWRLYEDPALDKLVIASLAANADLRVAYANLDAARAAFSQARAARLPQTSVETSLGVDSPANQPSASSLVPTTDYDIGLAASWDADLFGRLRSAALAAKADAEAQAAAVDGLKVAVVADTAQAYVDLCGAGQAWQVATEQVRLLERAAGLVKAQFRAGEVSPLEVAQAATLVETARAALPPLAAAAANARYRLATLQGRPPAEAPALALACNKVPALRAAAPLGDGGALLRRRPDIREAERRLVAASARIGVARADLYPRVNLGGALGLLSGGAVATASPLISWNFPNQAPTRARIRQARATERAALAAWDVAVLRALRDVETALAAYAGEMQRNRNLDAAQVEAERTARRAAARVSLGDAAYLLQIDAERTRAQTVLTKAQSDLAVAQAEVALFRALGGGWRSDAKPIQ